MEQNLSAISRTHSINQSAIKIENNGKMLIIQNTTHMSNQHFWTKDRIKNEGIDIEYFPKSKLLLIFVLNY